jgi:hypothetical protein
MALIEEIGRMLTVLGRRVRRAPPPYTLPRYTLMPSL